MGNPTVKETKEYYDKYLKDLENELQCSLPKLRSILEERNEMLDALIEMESYLTVELDYEWSEELCSKLDTVRETLHKVGCSF